MSEFALITSESEQNILSGGEYLIILRSITFVDGEQFGDVSYGVVPAIYDGHGVWHEMSISDSSVALQQENIMRVSCTRNAQTESVPDFFGPGKNDNVKYAFDVIAYAPYPAIPNLDNLSPMRI